jgi:recombination protein RecA
MIRDAKVIPEKAPMALVFDSLACMVPAGKIASMEKAAKEGKTGLGTNMRDKLGLATATSQELPAFMTFVEENNVLAVFLNQAREKPGVMYGDPTYTPGGKAPEFYASTRIKLSRQMLRDEKTKTVVGQKITAETVKNKTYRPFLKTAWFFRFNEDGSGYIDINESMIEHLIERGAFERPTAQTYVWEGVPLKRNQLGPIIGRDPEGMNKMIDMGEKLGEMPMGEMPADAEDAE